MITQQQRQQIKSLMQSPQWSAIENLQQDLYNKIANEDVIKDTEWDTLKTTLINQGQLRGIKRLFEELFTHASDT